MISQIPPITDPLGKHWRQPPASEIAIDDEVAMMTAKTFEALAEYSCTIPSGKYAGKMWKLFTGKAWYLRWYEGDPQDPSYLLIPNRLIVIC